MGENFFKRDLVELSARKLKAKTFEEGLFENVEWCFQLPVFADYFTKRIIKEDRGSEIKDLQREKVKEGPQVKEMSLVTQSGDFPSFIQELDGCLKCSRSCLKENTPIFHTYNREDHLIPPLKVLFVGDFPKSDEDKVQNKKLIFDEQTTELLSKMIKAMKLSEEEYRLTLSVKCLPVQFDKAEELSRECLYHFEREVAFFRPKVIVCLGAFASNLILGKKQRLSLIHGQFFDKTFKFSDQTECSTKIVPVFHPEYLLINPKMKKIAWQDLQKVMVHLGKI